MNDADDSSGEMKENETSMIQQQSEKHKKSLEASTSKILPSDSVILSLQLHIQRKSAACALNSDYFQHLL